jgi:TIR domain
MTKDSSGSRRFAVALSFPGKHRPFVEQVAGHLAAAFGRDRVLYDKYYEAEFARLDLDVYLPCLYRTQSELIVLFLCPEYAEKRWCNLEWRHIRQLIATVDASQIMLLRYGYSGEFEELGILSGDGTINFENRSPEDIAEKIRERFHINNGNSPPKSPPGPNEAASIAATQPPLPPPPPFPMAEAKDGPARFRPSGEPIGCRWDQFDSGAEQDVFLAAGPAIWLRLMPTVDSGERWLVPALMHQARGTGSLNLEPFAYHDLYTLRAEDGIAICTLAGSNAAETTSVAFAFETGEVWSVDTFLLSHEATRLFVGEIESLFTERLEKYARFLVGLGLEPPYQWIAGITGVKGRHLEIPLQPGKMRVIVVGQTGRKCLADTITKDGEYDGKQTPSSALYPFFEAIYAKCGVKRSDFLPRLG